MYHPRQDNPKRDGRDKLDLQLNASSSTVATEDLDASHIMDMYVAQRTSRDNATTIMEVAPRGRFVAGDAFFNYEAFGSLREGLEPVNLLSWSHVGLLANSMAAGFCLTIFHYVFRPLFVVHIATYHQEQTNSAKYLILWPGAFSVFIGLFSDCRPLFGLRRKPYILLGWIMACLMFVAIMVVDFSTDATFGANGYLFLIFSILAALGLQIAAIASLAMTVEFAQREHLYQRGHLQVLYLLFNFGTCALAQVLASHLVTQNDDGTRLLSHVSLGETALFLAVGCLLPMPFVWLCLIEDRVACQSLVSVARRIADLWHFLQHKAVYNMLFFIIGAVFLCGATDSTVSQALMIWGGVTPPKAGNVNIVKAAFKFFGVLFWKSYLVNYSWRRLAVIGMVANVLANAALTVPIVYGFVRNEWYYYTCTALGEISQGWLELFFVIPPTEIADLGREGATMGLVTSYMVLITIATYTLWDYVSDATGLNVSRMDVLGDSSSARNSIFLAAAVYLLLNLLAVVMVMFMPTQKLDAQQLRAYGGYNRTARWILLGVFLVLLIYGLVANLLKILG